MSVIASPLLYVRRLRELLRRRDAISAHREQLAMKLPDWAAEPLRLAGLSRQEIDGLVTDTPVEEQNEAMRRAELELERLDAEIEDLEAILAARPSRTLDEIEARLGLVLERLRDDVATSPDDLYYDERDARTLAMLERVHADCRTLLARDRRIPERTVALHEGNVISYRFKAMADASGLQECPDLPQTGDA
ncbi:hypothetical protein [Marinivivus vitaminiproducens]|uniref:hypothetical protein n=1 Tax=Marinivivus vitaminiproducens TaxID=3035935 RepID=UPI00279B34F7|nr:hypothetical protein P4R82_05665 [Geminicoccaceae bacterium SCSIO 64248]